MQKCISFPGDAGAQPFYPGSIVMISAVDGRGRADICTVGAWSLVNGAPRLFGIAMCARSSGTSYWKRYTTTCIEETGEFVINIPDVTLQRAWELCGSVSLAQQPDVDKFELAGLTAVRAARVGAPLIDECPVNIECRVHSRLTLPTHDWIVGEPVAFHTAAALANEEKTFDWERALRWRD